MLNTFADYPKKCLSNLSESLVNVIGDINIFRFFEPSNLSSSYRSKVFIHNHRNRKGILSKLFVRVGRFEL